MSSSSLRSTPVSTPCTPRRLSLAESFTNLRDSTKTTSTSLGLVRLLQERGISAAVYNPLSWDRADRAPPPDPCSSHTAHTCPDTLPSTPPNSPSKSKPSRAVLPVDYSPSDPPYETFLASRPASSILKEVREADERAETETQTEVSVQNLRLVDKVKKFSLAPRTLAPGPPFGAHAVVTSPIGGLPVLNSGMRRNRSYPAMVGASMAMKGAGPPSEDLLLAHGPPRQTSLNEKWMLPLCRPLYLFKFAYSISSLRQLECLLLRWYLYRLFCYNSWYDNLFFVYFSPSDQHIQYNSFSMCDNFHLLAVRKCSIQTEQKIHAPKWFPVWI